MPRRYQGFGVGSRSAVGPKKISNRTSLALASSPEAAKWESAFGRWTGPTLLWVLLQGGLRHSGQACGWCSRPSIRCSSGGGGPHPVLQRRLRPHDGPERHPSALGQPGRECWDEIWDTIGPQIEFVMAGRGSTWHENHLVPVTRHGKREDVWWTYSLAPSMMRIGSAAPRGVFRRYQGGHVPSHPPGRKGALQPPVRGVSQLHGRSRWSRPRLYSREPGIYAPDREPGDFGQARSRRSAGNGRPGLFRKAG